MMPLTESLGSTAFATGGKNERKSLSYCRAGASLLHYCLINLSCGGDRLGLRIRVSALLSWLHLWSSAEILGWAISSSEVTPVDTVDYSVL
jgi:hypothetical protein